MRLEGDPESPRLVTSRTKQDMTERMVSWSKKRVVELEKEGLRTKDASMIPNFGRILLNASSH